jgi:hypothetical protein
MNRRDQELLDKQLWGVSPRSPVERTGALGLALVAAFLGGVSLGGFLFAHTSNQMQMTAYDGTITHARSNGSPPTLQ